MTGGSFLSVRQVAEQLGILRSTASWRSLSRAS